MCVIIIIPKGKKISQEELKKAWGRNDDGAGFMYQKDGKVHYERGLMTLKEYKEKIKPLNGKYEMVLHLRISTSNQVNKLQTHPYEVGNITCLKNTTTNPVVCMNGTVKRGKLLKDCNDTMSYIAQNNELFNEFNNKDITNEEKIEIIDFIKEETSAKWCVMTPEGTFWTKGFTESNGLIFSNLKHRVKNIYVNPIWYKSFGVDDVIKNKKLLKRLRKNIMLYYDILDYVEEYCIQCNKTCTGCLKNAKNLKDIRKFRDKNGIKFADLYYIHNDAVIEYDYDYYSKNYSKPNNVFDE